MMRLFSLIFQICLLSCTLYGSSASDAEGTLLARFYKPQLVAVRNDVLNGAYAEGTRLFERQGCTGTQCPGTLSVVPPPPSCSMVGQILTWDIKYQMAATWAPTTCAAPLAEAHVTKARPAAVQPAVCPSTEASAVPTAGIASPDECAQRIEVKQSAVLTPGASSSSRRTGVSTPSPTAWPRQWAQGR